MTMSGTLIRPLRTRVGDSRLAPKASVVQFLREPVTNNDRGRAQARDATRRPSTKLAEEGEQHRSERPGNSTGKAFTAVRSLLHGPHGPEQVESQQA